MARYRDILLGHKKDDRFLTKAQADVWSQMRMQGTASVHMPVLIVNTTSTGMKPGVSLSVVGEMDGIFPGYIGLQGDTSRNSKKYRGLTYFDAISTSNRFPIMSPAAQVEDLGFFLDGGYFDNSGMLTTSYFRDYINKRLDTPENPELSKELPLKTVTILNSKDDYIRWFIKEHRIEISTINHVTNAKSIIAGILDINKLPNVLLAKGMTESNDLLTIYMPHPITTADIEGQMEGQVLWTNKLIEKITTNNDSIRAAVTRYYDDINPDRTGAEVVYYEGIVVPPLARTLSSPAVRYEIAMVREHHQVREQMQSVIGFLCESHK